MAKSIGKIIPGKHLGSFGMLPAKPGEAGCEA